MIQENCAVKMLLIFYLLNKSECLIDCNVSSLEMKKNENQLFESKNNVLSGGKKKERKICDVDTKETELKLCNLSTKGCSVKS